MRINADQAPTHTAPLVAGDVTGQIIGAFFEVYNELRFGFLEPVYARALEIEFLARGIKYRREVGIIVRYKGQIAGAYRADFVVERRVIVEVKAKPKIVDQDRTQLLNYLRGTNCNVGLVLNFGPTATFTRVVHEAGRNPEFRDNHRPEECGAGGKDSAE